MAAAALALAFGEPLWIPIYLVSARVSPPGGLAISHCWRAAMKTAAWNWYPPGRLLIWCTVIATVIVTIVMWNVRIDEQQFEAALKLTLDRMVKEYGTAAPDFTKIDVKRAGELIMSFVPPLAAAIITIAYALNFYIAGRVAMLSGRLKRPWPHLPALRFPKHTPAAFAVALMLWFLPGMLGMIGGIISGAMIIAYALMGLSILHDVTRPLGDRVFILSAIYLILFVFWPASVLLAMFGSPIPFSISGRPPLAGRLRPSSERSLSTR